jgi:hypothetical protein
MAGQTGVRLITIPRLDWDNYLKDVAELTGHSPTSSIDSSIIKLKGMAKYIISLGEFKGDLDPNSALRTSPLLAHLFFSFRIDSASSTMFKILEITDLSVTSATRKKPKGRVAIVSGNLKQWKDAVTTALSSKHSPDILWIFNECHQTFCQLGLTAVWGDYRKIPVTGTTYLLEYKP